MAYIAPKTSWNADSSPTEIDFNRIEGNTKQNHEDVITEASSRSSADVVLQASVNAEVVTRANADSALQASINAEAVTRANADAALQATIATKMPLPSTSTNVDEWNFPIGSFLLVPTTSGYTRNSIVSVYLSPYNANYSFNLGDGSTIYGTWRARGFSNNTQLVQRTQ